MHIDNFKIHIEYKDNESARKKVINFIVDYLIRSSYIRSDEGNELDGRPE